MWVISNIGTKNQVIKEKGKILKQFYSVLNGRENKVDLSLCGVEENIALWNLYTTDMQFYFYTNLQGKILFDGKCFPCASNFSEGCAWVKEDQWYIINLRKQELVEIPVEEMPWKNIRDIRHGNLAMANVKNKWGSYFYNQEENTFQEDVPFIWDALEFSRKKDRVYAGVLSSRRIINSLNEWGPEDLLLYLKMAKLSKTAVYNMEAYRYFLKQYFINPFLEDGKEISQSLEKISEGKKQEVMDFFVNYAHNIADDCFEESVESLFNTNTGANVVTESLETYKRVRGIKL